MNSKVYLKYFIAWKPIVQGPLCDPHVICWFFDVKFNNISIEQVWLYKNICSSLQKRMNNNNKRHEKWKTHRVVVWELYSALHTYIPDTDGDDGWSPNKKKPNTHLLLQSNRKIFILKRTASIIFFFQNFPFFF